MKLTKKQKDYIKIISVLIVIALFIKLDNTLSVSNENSIIFPKGLNVLSEDSEYIEYEIPLYTSYHLSSSCEISNSINLNFETIPNKKYIDLRPWGGEETYIPATSPLKNDLKLNREFIGEVSVYTNIIYLPCDGRMTNLIPNPNLKVICKVVGYTDDKQNINCNINGDITGVTSKDLIIDGVTIPEGTEIKSNLQIQDLNGAIVKVKMYKGDEPPNPKPNFLIYIIGIFIVGGIYFLYKKSKRKKR